MNITDLSPAFVAANKDILEREGIDVPAHMLPVDPLKRERAINKVEREIQTEIENWLRLRGYYRRGPGDILSNVKAPLGWQIHVHEAKKNPILLDILLLHNEGYCLEFEVKRQNGSYSSDEQRALCEQYHKPVVRSLPEAMKLVNFWESMIQEKELAWLERA